jgi:Ca-activated chloride channel family protein
LLALLLAYPAGPARANDTGEGIKAYQAGDYEKALKHFVDAQLHAPDKVESLYNVANGYYKTGNFDAAVDHYKKVLETEDKTLKQKAEYNLGNAEFRRGNAKTAIEHYKAALALDPDDQLTRENLEFVQKVLEQQQKQQQKSGGQEKDQKDQQQDQQGESKPDNNADDGNAENQQPQHRDPSGEKQTAADSGDKQDQPPPAPQREPSDPSDDRQAEDKQASQASAGLGQDQQESDPGQAERMLNRLQDQPGRALMPATNGQRVDKDW